MARPKKTDELEELKRQHAETAKRIAALEKERATRAAAEAKQRNELTGAAIFAHYKGPELAALLRDIVLPSLKRAADRELFADLLPANEAPPASAKKADKPAADEKVQAAE